MICKKLDELGGGRSRFLKATVSCGLSVAMVLGGVPASALAEAVDDPAVVAADAQIVGGEAITNDGIGGVEGADVVMEEVPEISEEHEQEPLTDMVPNSAFEGEGALTDVDADSVGAQEELPAETESVPDEELAEKLTADSMALMTQSVTYDTLPLNGPERKFTPTGNGEAYARIYTFTLSQTSAVQLSFQNRLSSSLSSAYFELWNDDMSLRHWQDVVGTYALGNASHYFYLKAGTYKVRVYCEHSSTKTGYLQVKGTSTVTTYAKTYPIRANTSFDKATPMKDGTSYKALFVCDEYSESYYKFTVSGGTKRVRIVCDTSVDEKADPVNTSLDSNVIYDSEKQWIGYLSLDRAWERDLPSGTYYVKISRGYSDRYTHSGPYTLKYRAMENIADADITFGASYYTYNGKQKTPTVNVTLNGKKLVKGTDFSIVTYGGTRRIDVGSYEVKIKGKGAYCGECTKKFQIRPASVKGATVTGAGPWKYTGYAIRPNPKVQVGGRTLVKDTDYTLSYKDNVQPGKGTVIIAGRGNYTGTTSKKFTINR